MICKALISFTGEVSMTIGEVKDIQNLSIAKDLLKAKYVEKVETKTVKKNKKESTL